MTSDRARGFTLIEMMVTLAVLTILVVAAVPSFIEMRQRAVVRGAADQVANFWASVRFEAIKRNAPVRVHSTVTGGAMCLGAETATTGTPCDCLTAGSCNIAQYPGAQSDWRGARFPSASTLGTTSGAGRVIIDPKRGNITAAADTGAIPLQSPSGRSDYRINVVIDRNGRAILCEPTTAPSKLPEYSNRRC